MVRKCDFMPLAVLAVLSVTGLEEMENFREEEMGLSRSLCFMAAQVGDGALWVFLKQKECLSNFAQAGSFATGILQCFSLPPLL